MPRKSDWIERLDSITEELEGTYPKDFLDRSDAQRLFGVSSRQATRILRRLGAETVGGALIMSRAGVLASLQALTRGEQAQYELRRRQRLAQQIEQARREARGRRVVIPVPEHQEPDRLPPGTELGAGKLEVLFEDPVELLQKLMQLAQLAAADWERFQRLARSTHRGAEPVAPGSR